MLGHSDVQAQVLMHFHVVDPQEERLRSIPQPARRSRGEERAGGGEGIGKLGREAVVRPRVSLHPFKLEQARRVSSDHAGRARGLTKAQPSGPIAHVLVHAIIVEPAVEAIHAANLGIGDKGLSDIAVRLKGLRESRQRRGHGIRLGRIVACAQPPHAVARGVNAEVK